MKHTSLLLGSVSVLLGLAVAAGPLSAAAPAGITVNGKTYYTVKANDPAMNTGNKVCAAVGKACTGFTSITNAVCLKLHPTAKALTSVNGSNAGFYCSAGAEPGLACHTIKNTCEVCPACNKNIDCTTVLQQFSEAYVECGGVTVKSITSSNSYGAPKIPLSRASLFKKTSSSSSKKSSSSSSKKSVTPIAPFTPFTPTPTQSSGITCTFTPHGAATFVYPCTAAMATPWCMTTMGGTYAATGTCNHGVITCHLSCSTPGASNIHQCAYGGVMQGSCASSSRPSAPAAGTGLPGQVCQHGGQCKYGMCLGVIPGQLYECSCPNHISVTGC